MAEFQTENTGISDAELFKGATATEPPAEVQGQETVTDERPRDEQGRFAPKPEDAKPEEKPAALTTEPPKDKPQDNAAMVPSWRLGEVSDERRKWQAEAEAKSRELEDSRRRYAALEQQHRQATEKPKEIPDLLADPNAFTSHLQETFDNRLRNMEANFSFRLAHSTHKDVFEKAYGEMVNRAERGDPSIVRSVMGSSDPGQALITWYKRDQTIAQVGDDPGAWLEKQLEERMKDPAFQAKVIEAARTQANGQNGSRPAVQIPPSLNRATSAGSHTGDEAGDMSDASLFRHAIAR